MTIAEGTVGEMLRSLRGNRSAATIAQETGVPMSAIYKIEKGKRSPSKEMALKLAEHYRVPAETLISKIIPSRRGTKGPRKVVPPPPGFPTYLRELRGDKTIQEVWKGTGTTHTTITQMERGETGLTGITATKLAEFYGVDIDEMIARAGARFRPIFRRETPEPEEQIIPARPHPAQPEQTHEPDPAESAGDQDKPEWTRNQAISHMTQFREELNPRQRHILDERLGPAQETLLADIGVRYGVTRERIRQIESKLKADIARDAEESESEPTGEFIQLAQQVLGPAIEEKRAREWLCPGAGEEDRTPDMLLIWAGPYRREGDWLVRQDGRKSDPTQAIAESADRGERLDAENAGKLLSKWGLHPSRHRAWLVRNGQITEREGTLFRTGRKLADRAVMELELKGKPTTIRDLAEVLGCSRATLNNTLQIEQRVIRHTFTKLALRKWGVREIPKSTVDTIVEFLKRNGRVHTMDVRKFLETELGSGARPGMMYAKAPAFIWENQYIRLREESDPPVRPSRKPTGRTDPSVIPTGEGRAGKRFKLRHDVLRGCSNIIGKTINQTLQIESGSDLELEDDKGRKIHLRYTHRMVAGPEMRSIGPILKEEGAEKDDWIFIKIDMNNRSFEMDVIRKQEMKRDWETVGRLTGMGRENVPERLSEMLRCEPEGIKDALEYRRDTTVLKYLPQG